MSIQLTPLTGNKEWEWKDEQEKAFQWIKEQMCKEPILWTLKDDGRMKMEVDSSGYAMGAVLMQEQAKQWRPITHISQTYNQAERNYGTGDRELLAIILALKKWRQYLLGELGIEVWTDHKNLLAFQKPQHINRRQA